MGRKQTDCRAEERAEKKSLKESERKEVRKVEKKGGVGRTQKTLPRTSEPVR